MNNDIKITRTEESRVFFFITLITIMFFLKNEYELSKYEDFHVAKYSDLTEIQGVIVKDTNKRYVRRVTAFGAPARLILMTSNGKYFLACSRIPSHWFCQKSGFEDLRYSVDIYDANVVAKFFHHKSYGDLLYELRVNDKVEINYEKTSERYLLENHSIERFKKDNHKALVVLFFILLNQYRLL